MQCKTKSEKFGPYFRVLIWGCYRRLGDRARVAPRSRERKGREESEQQGGGRGASMCSTWERGGPAGRRGGEATAATAWRQCPCGTVKGRRERRMTGGPTGQKFKHFPPFFPFN